jgi:hypothetical protein
MADYDLCAVTVRPLPPLCPKCGSHRTEVVGQSPDGHVLIIRCNACGERSEVDTRTMGRTMGTYDETENGGNDKLVVSEVDVMMQLAHALGTLPDLDARRRVLRWAMERYHVDIVTTAAIGAAPAEVSGADDSSLAVDCLEDFFPAKPAGDGDGLEVVPEVRPPVAPETQPGVETLIRAFAADFRRFAHEWQGT